MKNIEKYEEVIKKQIAEFRDIPCIAKELKDGGCCECRNCVTCSMEMLHWLSQEYKAPVLTEEGKAYLSNLLKPYGLGTCAFQFNLSEVVKNDTYKLTIADEYGTIINLAIRQDSEMQELFRKMQFNKVYAVKELGL